MASSYPATASLPQSGSIVSRWLLDEASGNRADIVGSNTLTDNNTVLAATGYNGSLFTYDNAADFEAANTEYLSIADGSQSGLDITGDLTLSCRVKLESIGVSHDLIAKWDNGSQNAYRLGIGSGDNKPYFSIGSPTEKTLAGATALIVGVWYHITAVYVPTLRMEIYINGVSDATTAVGVHAALANGTANFKLGSSDVPQYLDGAMQDAIVWNTSLTDTEVGSLA